GLKNYDKTFEFIIHKPRATKRFDFYLSATPYDATSFKNLAANVRAMYPASNSRSSRSTKSRRSLRTTVMRRSAVDESLP
ncbi:hypothetical protein ACFQH8_20575, partial [Halomicroarcula sp. GCM10025710]